jgi:hypothetical protein
VRAAKSASISAIDAIIIPSASKLSIDARTSMRTTWNVDNELVGAVKDYARTRSISSGEAASQLIRRGLKAGIGIRYEQGIPVFDTAYDSPIVTLEHTLLMEDELL